MGIRYGQCPNCGSEMVIYDEDYWECSWCGDFGGIGLRVTADHLLEIWAQLKNALETICPEHDQSLLHELGRTAVYEIARGLGEAEKDTADDRIRRQELKLFLRKAPHFGVDVKLREILADREIFRDTAELTEERCGSFWAHLIRELPAAVYYENGAAEEDALTDLFQGLECLYRYFRGRWEDGGARPRRWVREEVFLSQWRRYLTLHPDGTRAKRLLEQGILPREEDVCQEILLTEYPQWLAPYTAQNLAECSWCEIVQGAMEEDARQGVSMWRTLLDTAEGRLQTDEEVAEELLPNWIKWEWLEKGDRGHLMPFLEALEEDRFARQVFQSASVSDLQRDLLSACGRLGETALGERLLELLKESPFPQGRWEYPLEMYERGLSARPARRERGTPPGRAAAISGGPEDGSTRFSFCLVEVEGIDRPLFYLTGGLPLQAGDLVEVPVGRTDRPARGRVLQVQDHTAATAPWPPEKTKPVGKLL